MRVDDNAGVLENSANGVARSADYANDSKKTQGMKSAGSQGKLSKSGNLYAGNLMLGVDEDAIEKKRKQAQAMAMQLVSNVYENEKKIDQDVEARNQKVKDLADENQEHKKIIDDIAVERQLLEEQGVAEDDERMISLNNAQQEYEKKIFDNDNQIIEENAIVRGIAIERLKQHDMVDASKQADEIKDAANKEIIGMVIDEAKDHVDETMEESKEEAAEKKEEEKALEERIEAAKNDKKTDKSDKEDGTENIYELAGVLNEIQTDSQQKVQEDMKKSLDQIVGELKLTAEDLKGAAIDENI